jgi:hypothetical protein
MPFNLPFFLLSLPRLDRSGLKTSEFSSILLFKTLSKLKALKTASRRRQEPPSSCVDHIDMKMVGRLEHIENVCRNHYV